VLFPAACFGAAVLALWFISTSAQAEPESGFAIDTSRQVVYCAAQWNGNREALVEALEAGAEVTLNWRIRVARVRDYWLNENVAEITFSRRVQPDLLARNWLLEDSASGISRHVFTLAEAIDFLTSIKAFPVLDKTLLSSGEVYELTIAIEKQEGAMAEAWWARFWKKSALQMQQEFSLP